MKPFVLNISEARMEASNEAHPLDPKLAGKSAAKLAVKLAAKELQAATKLPQNRTSIWPEFDYN